MMTTIDVATLAEAQAHEQRLREQAGELRLHGLLGRWAEVMGNPEQSRWVGQLLGWEAAERHRRSLKRRLRDARIGAFKPLADFDWKWPTHCDRAIVEELMTLTFLEDASNIVLVGPNGVAIRCARATWTTRRCWPGARHFSSRRRSCWASWRRWTATLPCVGGFGTTRRRICS